MNIDYNDANDLYNKASIYVKCKKKQVLFLKNNDHTNLEATLHSVHPILFLTK